jgi:hypothetical protein
MSEQPEALRLADALENLRRWHELTDDDCNEAAAELRRLSAVNQELLEALKLIASAENSALDLAYCKGIARAAIARAEGQV